MSYRTVSFSKTCGDLLKITSGSAIEKKHLQSPGVLFVGDLLKLLQAKHEMRMCKAWQLLIAKLRAIIIIIIIIIIRPF